MMDTDICAESYLQCALWTCAVGDIPLDAHYALSDIAPESLDVARLACHSFLLGAAETIERARAILPRYDAALIGHDLWLTRNHHGTGYWDRGLGDVGEILTVAAQVLGETDLYTGDDGKLYLS